MFRNPLTDVIVVLVIVLLIMGPKRLPQLGRGLGQGMREFKEGITGDSKDDDSPTLHQATAVPEAANGAPAPTEAPMPAPGQVPPTSEPTHAPAPGSHPHS